MRTTKIFFKRFGVINGFFGGALVALIISLPVFGGIAAARHYAQPPTGPIASVTRQSTAQTLASDFEGYRIATYGELAGQTFYIFVDPEGRRTKSEDLFNRDVLVKDRGPREALLVRGDDFLSIYR